MDNRFENKGKDQNIAQGDGAISKQTNIFLQPLKPRILALASILAAGVLGAGLVGWHLLTPKPTSTSTSMKNSIFITSDNDGEQIIAQGERAVGKQINHYYGGISQKRFEALRDKYAVTDSSLASFFKILDQKKVQPGDLDAKLREIAAQYKELLARLETVQSEDPEVVQLKKEARQAIEAGDYAKAEDLLNQAETLDLQAIEELDKQEKQIAQAKRQLRISAAASRAENARLQRVQLHYAKATEYWKKAVDLLPPESRKKQADYLYNAAYDLQRIAHYSEALPLYEQSLGISREIGDRSGEGEKP
ncbi:MAG: hypothetical protein D3924_13930 [Candidatus Electrothrix sp. AR4]|nr:hypothetical protein [Candidatus Electrothrix sp. AR4]